MLMKPSILTLPDSSFPVDNTVGCTSGTYYAPSGGKKCSRGFSCQPYSYNSNSCVDCTYSGTCSYTLGVGLVGAGIGVGVTAGVYIT